LSKNHKKQVAENKQRKYALDIEKLTFRRALMSKQAKTLTAQELRKVLDYVATRPHAHRNRMALLLTFYAGLRSKEVASLRYSDVLDVEGKVKSEIYLAAEQTKGGKTGTVFVSEKLRKELQTYITLTPCTSTQDKLIYTQKRGGQGFTANTLTQHFHYLYKRAGIAGASSHSGRRTFITNLADKGVGVRVLMSLARHANISTTQAYIDVNEAMQRRAVELL
jgi:integrase/recombinase XerD